MDQVLDHKNQNISTQDWAGLKPEKWHGGRLHIKPKDSLLSNYQAESQEYKGKKTYPQKISDIYEYKPHNKQFQSQKQTNSNQEKLIGKKHYDYQPTLNRDRAQRKHLTQKDKVNTQYKSSIQTYDYANQTRGQNWQIESQMNQKQRINYLEEQRNFIECQSLGDKPYKNPEWSANFYKQGGLVPGSTIQAKPIKNASEKQLSSTRVPGKLTWKDRVKQDERQLEQDAIDELDDWVESVLKEANPNYIDVEELERKEKEEEEQRMKELANPELKQDDKNKKASKKDTKKGKK